MKKIYEDSVKFDADMDYNLALVEVESYFAGYNFEQKTLEKYAKVICQNKQFYEKRGLEYDVTCFFENFELCVDILNRLGVGDQKAVVGAKSLVLLCGGKSINSYLSQILAMNFLDRSIEKDFEIVRMSRNKVNARYQYLLDIGYDGDIYNSVVVGEKTFVKRFGVSSSSLVDVYSYNDEAKKVQMHLFRMSDEELVERYGLNREQMAIIYPTTKKTLGLLKVINQLSSSKVMHYCGISREQLLQIPKLDYATFMGLIDLNKSTHEELFYNFDVVDKEDITSDPRFIRIKMKKLASKL